MNEVKNWIIFFVLFGGLVAGWEGRNWYLNKDAQYHVGDCFKAKSAVPATLKILAIDDGKYKFRFMFLFLKKDDEEIISRFDKFVKDEFDRVDCETGVKK